MRNTTTEHNSSIPNTYQQQPFKEKDNNSNAVPVSGSIEIMGAQLKTMALKNLLFWLGSKHFGRYIYYGCCKPCR